MAVTGQQVLDLALTLIDEVSENGTITQDNPNYYVTRSKNILSVLQAELGTASIINNLSDNLDVDDNVAIKVLPYGLAAHLLIQEDVNTASFFNNRYDELKVRIPKSATPIVDKYDVLNGMM